MLAIQLAIQLVFIIFFSFLLIKATEILVQALIRLSGLTRIGKFALTSFLLALATSFPELFVCITAALEKKPNLALGNILGSNIANLSLVTGGAALIGGSIGIVGNFWKKDLLATFLAATLPLVLLLDNRLSQVEGLLLILIYGVYNYTILRGKRKKRKKIIQQSFSRRILRRLNHKGTDREFAWVFLGAALLLFSADMIVKTASLIAQQFGVPLILIGLFIISIGTTLPEFTFELEAIRKREVGMVFGNLLGSIIANSTLIMGITSLITPVKLEGGLEHYLLATIAFLVIFAFFWVFVRTKKKLERWEGLVLIWIYFLFVWLEFLRVRS